MQTSDCPANNPYLPDFQTILPLQHLPYGVGAVGGEDLIEVGCHAVVCHRAVTHHEVIGLLLAKKSGKVTLTIAPKYNPEAALNIDLYIDMHLLNNNGYKITFSPYSFTYNGKEQKPKTVLQILSGQIVDDPAADDRIIRHDQNGDDGVDPTTEPDSLALTEVGVGADRAFVGHTAQRGLGHDHGIAKGDCQQNVYQQKNAAAVFGCQIREAPDTYYLLPITCL